MADHMYLHSHKIYQTNAILSMFWEVFDEKISY